MGKTWVYCRDEQDAGKVTRKTKRGYQIDLFCKSKTVFKVGNSLYLRSDYNTRELSESISGKFQVFVNKHFVSGVNYPKLSGYVLWRNWFQKIETRGGHRLQWVNQELLAAYLNGQVIFRLGDGPTITPLHKSTFQEVFDPPLSPIEQLLEDCGYEVDPIEY